MDGWYPPTVRAAWLIDPEAAYGEHVATEEGTEFYRFLAGHRHEIFPDTSPTCTSRDSLAQHATSLLKLVPVQQAHDDLSEEEGRKAGPLGPALKTALGVGATDNPFAKRTFQELRTQLRCYTGVKQPLPGDPEVVAPGQRRAFGKEKQVLALDTTAILGEGRSKDKYKLAEDHRPDGRGPQGRDCRIAWKSWGPAWALQASPIISDFFS